MRLWLAPVLLALAMGATAVAATDADDASGITVLDAPGEQRVEGLAPVGEQRVEAVDAAEAQRVEDGTVPEANRGPRKAAKVVVGVLAAGFSLAFMAASLLLF